MKSERTILITGFDPFGGESVNPSWEAVRQLPDSIFGVRIIKLMIPTVAYKSIDILTKAIEEYGAELAVSVGQAGGRASICLESVAYNENDFKIPDNEGNLLRGIPVIPGSQDGYPSTLDLEAMGKVLLHADIPCKISEDAGRFVCNHLFYGVCDYIKRNNLSTRYGFIHVPYLPEQAEKKGKAESMSLSLITRALSLMLEAYVLSENSLL